MRLLPAIRLVAFLTLFYSPEAFGQKALSFSDSVYILDLFSPRSNEELIHLNEAARTDIEKLRSLLKLCASIYADPYQVNAYRAQAYILAQKINSKKEIGLCYMFGIGQTHSKKAIDSCASQAQRIFDELGDAGLYYLTKLYAASALYRYSPNYVEPFRLLEQFIANYHIRNDQLSMAKAYNVRGEIFRTLENYPEAIKN